MGLLYCKHLKDVRKRSEDLLPNTLKAQVCTYGMCHRINNPTNNCEAYTAQPKAIITCVIDFSKQADSTQSACFVAFVQAFFFNNCVKQIFIVLLCQN